MATGTSANGKTYNITSEKGTTFLNTAKAGTTMTGGDGSTWTKNADGSTTIKQGNTTYTVAGSSSGGGTSSSKSGSSSSKSGGSSSGSGSSATLLTGNGSSGTTGKSYTSNSSTNGKAYTVTSEKGVNFIENAAPGQTLVGGDGSQWTKNADGSVTINQNGSLYTIGGSSSGGQNPQQTGDYTYTPLGNYYDAGLSEADKARVDALSEQWKRATAQGNAAEADQYHEQAEAIREKYGYSGGTDGSQYIGNELPENTIPQAGLPTYAPQTEQVDKTYDAAGEYAKSVLKTAFDQSKLDQAAAMAKIAPYFMAQRNDLGAENEIEKRNFREAAAGSGLNAGTSGQAALSMSNQYMGAMTELRNAQATAEANAELELTKLYTKYQDEVAEALLKNEYERAAALMAEYQEAAKSVVDVAQAQADLDIRTETFNRETDIENQERERLAQQEAEKLKQQAFENAYTSGWAKLESGSSALTAEELAATGLSAQNAQNIAYNYLMQLQGYWR